MKKISYLFLLLTCLGLPQLAAGQTQEKFDFYTRGPYSTGVPRPQVTLRFDVGDHHTTYAQMERVIEQIAAAAPSRVRVFDIGLTNEHRMQHLVAISSPENIARLDEIKATIARLTDPRRTSASEAAAIAQDTPAVAWMAYTIHGNESASFETMMQVAYQLAASDEPATLEILRNCVVLIVTGENPDGHERFATWYNSVATGDANRSALEHREPWSIYGRGNHYRFDLNRDTLAMTQKETQNLARAYQEWNPQVAVDHHGQVSQFFFPPVALPINPNLPQPVTAKWETAYGRANARAFDANRWDYYVRDRFDAFYPGYWDMYPNLNGATGMTYETDGGGTMGLRFTRDDGTIATLRSAIAKHFVASMATLETTAANRAAKLRDFYDFRAAAMRGHSSAKLKRVFIDPTKDPVKAADLIEVLQRSKIEVGVARQAITSQTAHAYYANSPAVTRTFPAGSYVVDLDQPQRLLIKSILEPDTPQDQAFVNENLARFRRNQMKGVGQAKEEYGFYDITAWSLPLVFGVDAAWTEDAGTIQAEAVTAEMLAAARRGSVAGRAQAAYIVPYSTDTTPAFIMRLMQSGYRVAVATRPLNAGGRNWPQGTFVVRINRNPESVHDAVSRLAGEMGIHVAAANTGFTEEGDTGIGGESVYSLREPKIAIAADDAVSQTSYGSIWWTLDRYGIRFTPITIRAIRGGALRDYNVLILPDGSASQYMSQFDSSGVARLKRWVEDGGTLITARGSSVFAALKDAGLSSTRLVGSDEDEERGKIKEEPSPSPTPVAKKAPGTAPAETSPNPTREEMTTDRSDGAAPSLPPIASPSADANNVPAPLPGSIMRATVDRTTYLTYGIEQNEVPVLLASGYFFRYSKEGTNAVVFEAGRSRPLTMSGFVWPGNTERLLAGTSYLIDESQGRGHVILFAEDPFFRGILRSNTRLFFNSILFNGVF